jgi:hypothetical protein
MPSSRHFSLVFFNQFNPFFLDGACQSLMARLRFIQSKGNQVSIVNYISSDLTNYFFSDTLADIPKAVIRNGNVCRAVFHGIHYNEYILPFGSGASSTQSAFETILQDFKNYRIDYVLTTDEAYIPLLVMSFLNISSIHFRMF